MITQEVADKYGVAKSTVWRAFVFGRIDAVNPHDRPLAFTEEAAERWNRSRKVNCGTD